MAKLSPMMEQYFRIKEQHKDHILFYRLGDFYEMFYDDAILASKELELTLTGRDCGQEERAPMCGVPYHSCEGYIARLIKKGGSDSQNITVISVHSSGCRAHKSCRSSAKHQAVAS